MIILKLCFIQEYIDTVFVYIMLLNGVLRKMHRVTISGTLGALSFFILRENIRILYLLAIVCYDNENRTQ